MTEGPVVYEADGEEFEGWLARAARPKGAVVLIHQWGGVEDYERRRAAMLAELGYDAFAIDMFGRGVRPTTVIARRAETRKLYGDRARMRKVAAAGLAAAAGHGLQQVVLAGYCFGGSVALEVARQQPSGVVGYASFHGGLDIPEGQDFSAAAAPIRIYHGGADTAVGMTSFARCIEALEAGGTPYKAEIYSEAPHAFSVFGTDSYHETADRESWADFNGFLEECLAR